MYFYFYLFFIRGMHEHRVRRPMKARVCMPAEGPAYIVRLHGDMAVSLPRWAMGRTLSRMSALHITNESWPRMGPREPTKPAGVCCTSPGWDDYPLHVVDRRSYQLLYSSMGSIIHY